MRARRRRSHHSPAPPPGSGVNWPRIAKPSACSTASAASISPAGKPTESATACEIEAALAVLQRSEEHTSELQSRLHLVCRLLLEKKKKMYSTTNILHECN